MSKLTPMAVTPHKKFQAFDTALGRVIADTRKHRKLSQEQLANRIGMPLSLLKRVEKGTRSVSVSELETIADVFRIPASDLAEDAVNMYGGVEKLRAEARGEPVD